MAVKVAELYETLELDKRKFEKNMSSAKKDSGKFSKMLGGIGTAAAAGAAAAGAALAGAAAKGVKEFANFDKQMNEVFTLMPKASEEAQKQMSDDLRAFSNEMGVATDEAAPALYQAISAGVPKDNVFNFMEEAQKAATAGVTDLTTSVDVLSSVVNTYGEENISAAEASDLMFTAVKQGKTTFEELSANMSDVAPIASSIGIEFSNITAALSTMTSQGTPTAKATTQLKQAMAELSKEGSKAGTAFSEVAGTDFQTFISEGGNLQEAMSLMEEAAKENGTTVSNMFGSIEAGQAALALTGEGAKKFKGDLEEMNSASGATDKAYKKMEESLTRNFERIQVGMNEVWLTVGEQLMPIMKDLTDWVIANMPKIQATAETVFSGVSDAIYWGIDAYKQIKSFVEDFVSENSESLNAVMADYQEIFDSIKQIITIFVGWAKQFWSAYGENIISASKAMWQNVKNIFNMQLNNIRDLFQGIVKLMQGDFEGFGEELGNIGSRMFATLVKVIENSWKNIIKPAIEELVEKIIQGFNELPEKMKEAGGNIVEGVKKGITDKAKGAVDTVTGFAGSLINKFGEAIDAHSPSRVFMGYGRNIVEGVEKGIEDNTDKAVSGLEKLWNDMQKAEKFESKWEEKLFGQTATVREKLEKQKKLALEYANKIGADTAAVEQYFANEFAKIEQEKQKKIREMRQQTINQRNEATKNYMSRLIEQNASEKEMLILKMNRELEANKNNEQAKWAIKQYWQNKIDKLEEENHQKSMERTEKELSFLQTGFAYAFSSILQGTKSVTEAFHDMWINVLNKVMDKLAEMAASKVFKMVIDMATGGGGSFFGNMFGGIFHDGGTVPGPIGQERLILAQAGETVSPIGSSGGSGGGGYSTANISVNLDGKTIAQAVKQPLVDTIRITGGARF